MLGRFINKHNMRIINNKINQIIAKFGTGSYCNNKYEYIF